MSTSQLQKTLGPWMIWGLGVGYVISGMYFGWNLGLAEGGPLGMLAALLFVTALYVPFSLCYAELACSIPHAGGAFAYAERGLGRRWGLFAGIAQGIEFIFAPPAIAAAIGAYFHLLFPALSITQIAISAYFIFTLLNIWGVRHSAIFELFVTVFAVGELVLFMGVTAPHFSVQAFLKNSAPHGFAGAFAAIPYAIWFYLGIEGLANISEEAHDPGRNIPRGFIRTILTLVVLALGVFFCATGIDGWESIVYLPGSTQTTDSPLPMALRSLLGEGHFLYQLLVSVGIGGLIASFHGILFAAGRTTLEFGRKGYAPSILAKVDRNRGTPMVALIFNLILGVAALLSGSTSELITLSVFGALTMYMLACCSVLAIRRKEPNLVRPYRAPCGSSLPKLAITIAVLCLFAMFYSNPKVGAFFVALSLFGLAVGEMNTQLSRIK